MRLEDYKYLLMSGVASVSCKEANIGELPHVGLTFDGRAYLILITTCGQIFYGWNATRKPLSMINIYQLSENIHPLYTTSIHECVVILYSY